MPQTISQTEKTDSGYFPTGDLPEGKLSAPAVQVSPLRRKAMAPFLLAGRQEKNVKNVILSFAFPSSENGLPGTYLMTDHEAFSRVVP